MSKKKNMLTLKNTILKKFNNKYFAFPLEEGGWSIEFFYYKINLPTLFSKRD
jgi:hypothetical protein